MVGVGGGAGGTADNAHGETSVDRLETSLKSCEAEHCDHPERTGRQVGDKCEILRADNPECSGRQLWETSGSQVRNSIQSGLGDRKWETSLTSCGQRIQSVVGDNWRQVRNHPDQSTHSIQSELGGKWETSLKSRGQRIQSVVGDKWETSAKSGRPKHSQHPE